MPRSNDDEAFEKTILPQKSGRITIPVEIRRELGIDENSALHLKLVGDKIEITLAPRLDEDRFFRKYEWNDIQANLKEDVLREELFEDMIKTIRIWPEPRPKPRIFLDVSVLIAGLHSQPNYSRLVVEICRLEKADLYLSELVIRETDRLVRKTMNDQALAELYAMLSELEPEIIPLPRTKVIEMMSQAVEDEQAHIYSSALAGGVSIILSLDRKYFKDSARITSPLPIQVLTPREFTETTIPA